MRSIVDAVVQARYPLKYERILDLEKALKDAGFVIKEHGLCGDTDIVALCASKHGCCVDTRFELEFLAHGQDDDTVFCHYCLDSVRLSVYDEDNSDVTSALVEYRNAVKGAFLGRKQIEQMSSRDLFNKALGW